MSFGAFPRDSRVFDNVLSLFFCVAIRPESERLMFDFRGSCWLTEGEKEEVLTLLVSAGLIKWDNARSLPLRSGGTTDVYINLRQMRSFPEVLGFLGEAYANALRRLRVNRFVEVPEAVSPLAGVVATASGIPLATIREQSKEGRVVSGDLVGYLNPGDRVAVLDDVVTDAASKLSALSRLVDCGAETAGIVVLVDRQQGWQKKLADAGFGNVGVWPGMTLHDVRKYLVNNGLMQRCDPAKEQKNPFIVALDGKSWDEVLPIADRLRPTGCILKVNDLLFDEGISRLMPNLSVYGRVMADLKCHDIPNTVANTCRKLRACPPWAVTVHAAGSKEMIQAAKKELEGTPTKVLAVTVLTSLNQEACQYIFKADPSEEVLALAEMACHAGADGFVCSPQEVARLKAAYPNKILVTPGIRSPGNDAQDQQRVDTPENAIRAGASHLVMGRQILNATDPVAEVNRIMEDELGID